MNKIIWTDVTWNPITGCSKISPGCDHCYAERMANTRLRGRYGYPADEPFRPGTFHADKIGDPLIWRRPKKIFVCSMSDLFHDDVAERHISAVVHVMESARRMTFQILTKRPGNMLEYFRKWQSCIEEFGELPQYVAHSHPYSRPSGSGHFQRTGETRGIPDNFWLGTTVESQEYLSRATDLVKIPARVRFLSLEPLLGPVDIYPWPWDMEKKRGIHWVIVGGESGPGARPMNPEWVRQVRDKCQSVGVPFFFKGWGGVNKKSTGRMLDGRTWDEFPVTA